VIVFYFPLVCLPLTVVFAGHQFVMPEGWAWASLLMVGLFTQVGQITLTRAMQTETASRATSLSYLQVVFAALLGMLVFHEMPSIWTIAGASLIMVGALVTVFWRSSIPITNAKDNQG
jgi:drug/metabolite transporter (DMT)-like permease